MKLDKQTLIMIGIILVLAYLLTSQCRKEPSGAAAAGQQKAMMQRVADSVRQLQAKEDSLVIRKKDHQIDSLVPLTNAAKQKVNDKGRHVLGIATAVQEAKEKKDTASYYANCDSLTKELGVAAQAVINYEYQVDTLVGALQEQRRIQDSISWLHHRKELVLMQALDSSDVRLMKLTSENEKLSRKASKRWGFGPGAGGTYMNGKPQPVLDIGVHYDLFRF